MFLRALKSDQPPATLSVAGQQVALDVRQNQRARRYNLKIDSSKRTIVLTIPRGGSLREGLSFARSKQDWLARQLKKSGDVVWLQAGASVPLRGVRHVIVPSGQLRGLVETCAGPTGPELVVPGEPDRLGRRLERFFREEARADLQEAVAWHAENLGKQPKAIQIKDTRSRWGSCSAQGVLAFSWRIVLAPDFALDYLAAHEVAHLREMNHGQRFWALVRELCPDMDRGRDWLRTEGHKLHLYQVQG